MIFIFSIYFLVLFINNIILALQEIFCNRRKKNTTIFIITSVVFYIFFHLFSFWV